MPVIIHEMEVEALPQENSSGEAAPPAHPPRLSAQSVERVVCRIEQRLNRIRAD